MVIKQRAAGPILVSDKAEIARQPLIFNPRRPSDVSPAAARPLV